MKDETKYLILVRNTYNGAVFVITSGEHDNAMLYDSEEEAEAAARNIPVCEAWPWSVVEAP
jgi:hypothetical protein